ncbi:MAG: FixH family protein [Bacteroidetes bacterium]|nr:FixH family protein [Bacteroidota bacterium]
MNWGYKIVVVYGLFVVGIGYMAYKSSTQKMDLVTTDYYAKEVKYQDQIDAVAHTNALSAPVRCELNANTIVLHFPKDFDGKQISGSATLYCPSDEDKDINQDFKVQDAPVIIKLKPGNKGQNEIHLSWKADGINYYFEQRIFI